MSNFAWICLAVVVSVCQVSINVKEVELAKIQAGCKP